MNPLFRVTITYGAAHFDRNRKWTCVLSCAPDAIHREARSAFYIAVGTTATGPQSQLGIYTVEAQEVPGGVFYQRQPSGA